MRRGKKIFRTLAVLLECPDERVADEVSDAIGVLEAVNWEAKLHLEHFLAFCRSNPLNSLKELYADTFDCNAHCCPYVGHHLFGHDRSRTLFAAKLKEHYLPHVVARNEQVPDHIAVILRSLIVQESVEEARDLISHCLIPATKKMIATLDNNDNPYQEVLRAILLTLQAEERLAGSHFDQYAGVR